jgi:hypothetical protein
MDAENFYFSLPEIWRQKKASSIVAGCIRRPESAILLMG